MAKLNGDIRKKIVALISKKPFGLTIEEVSCELKINRATASKYLAVLEATDKVLVRELGKAKLHYPNNRRVKAWML